MKRKWTKEELLELCSDGKDHFFFNDPYDYVVFRRGLFNGLYCWWLKDAGRWLTEDIDRYRNDQARWHDNYYKFLLHDIEERPEIWSLYLI